MSCRRGDAEEEEREEPRDIVTVKANKVERDVEESLCAREDLVEDIKFSM